MAGFTQILDNTWQQYTKLLHDNIAIGLLLYFIPYTVFMALVSIGIITLPEDPSVTFVVSALAIFIPAVVALIFFSFWYTASIMRRMVDKTRSGAMRSSLKYILRLTGVSILIGLVVAGIILIIALPIVLAWVAYGTAGFSAATVSLVLLTILAAMLCLAAVLYVAVYWTFATYEVVFGGKGVTAALRGSQKLVVGKWWRVCGYILFLGLVGLAISIVLVVITLPLSLATLVVSERTSVVLDFVSNIITSVGTLFTSPFSIIFIKNLYDDVRKRS